MFPAGRRGGLSRFYLLGLFSGSYGYFNAVIVERAAEFGFNAAAQTVGRNDVSGGAKTEDPGNELEFASYMQFHTDAPAINLAALLGGMPDSRTDVFSHIGTEYQVYVKRFFLHQTERRFQIGFHRKVRRFLKMIVKLFDGFNALDGERANLLVLLDVTKKIKSSAEVHQAIGMQRVLLPLLAMHRVIAHFDFHHGLRRFHQHA